MSELPEFFAVTPRWFLLTKQMTNKFHPLGFLGLYQYILLCFEVQRSLCTPNNASRSPKAFPGICHLCTIAMGRMELPVKAQQCYSVCQV